MEFRLVYQGTLLVENNKGGILAARANHKHEIRRALHPQLRKLWQLHPFLKEAQTERPNTGTVVFGSPSQRNTIPSLANRFSKFGYRFVPLVTRELELKCSLDILFLRNDPPGSLLSAGDIDNRLKTLFDGLIIPNDEKQLGTYLKPEPNEEPFFCLLEDDSLITKVAVETDTLLAPVSDPPNVSDARVISKVTIQPYRMKHDTIGFG